MDNRVILIPVPLDELLQNIRDLIRSEIQAKQAEEFEAKLLSPAEVCKLFQPKISKVTLNSWTKAGRLQSHRIGSRIFYRHADVMSSLQTLKRYKKSL